MNIPKLRFPQFKDDWEKHNLGEIASFSKGKGISKADIVEDGAIECIRYGELYTTYGETISEVKSRTNIDKEDLVFSEANDVIIPASGETQIDIATASCVLREGIALGGDLNIIKTKNNGVFLSYYLNSKKKLDIASLAQGISVVHLYSSQLSLLGLNLPLVLEQDKIALFLRSIDEKLQLLKKKKRLLEDYKKGVMQKLFSQELRFKDEKGKNFPDWEEKNLSDLIKLQGGFAFKSEQFKKKGIPVIRISNISNDNNYIDLSNVVYYDKINNADNFTIKKWDLIIAMSGATTGKSSIYNLDDIAYLNQRVGLFRPIEESLYYGFLIQFVFSDLFKQQLEASLVAGAQPNISSSDIERISLSYPSKNEQKKIADFLNGVDTKIHLTEEEISRYENWKNGLMQKMFC